MTYFVSYAAAHRCITRRLRALGLPDGPETADRCCEALLVPHEDGRQSYRPGCSSDDALSVVALLGASQLTREWWGAGGRDAAPSGLDVPLPGL